MKALLLAKHKRSAVRALETLVNRGCDVRGVVVEAASGDEHSSQRTDEAAQRLGVELIGEEEAYALAGEVDVAISFLYPRLIREPLISGPGVGCLNFHPAPLPDMRGVGGYNVAVLEGMSEWGVSCHFVEPDFDTGDIVEVERFPVDPDTATAFSLDLESQERLYGLFQRVMRRTLADEELPRTPQGEGRYVDRAEFEALRRVRPGDDLDRKLRAFWYPPYPGAVLEVDGRELTLVDEGLLADMADAYRDLGLVP